MVDALCRSTGSILSCGLTTVIGFLALVRMQFQIGPDLGLALAKGVVLEGKRTTGGASAPSAAYVRLVDVTKQLQDMVGRSRGRANKDLGRLADQLKAIMEKWDA